MSQELIDTAADLADALARENAALAALDLPAAALLLDDKRRTAEAFTRAHAAGSAERSDALAETIARLRDTAQENRRLIERAIVVQGQVVALIARAVPRQASGFARYGANGGIRAEAHAPMSLSARA